MPVIWNNVEGSKVSLMGGLNGYLDLLRVRWNDMRGRYDGKTSARSISTIAD